MSWSSLLSQECGRNSDPMIGIRSARTGQILPQRGHESGCGDLGHSDSPHPVRTSRRGDRSRRHSASHRCSHRRRRWLARSHKHGRLPRPLRDDRDGREAALVRSIVRLLIAAEDPQVRRDHTRICGRSPGAAAGFATTSLLVRYATPGSSDRCASIVAEPRASSAAPATRMRSPRKSRFPRVRGKRPTRSRCSWLRARSPRGGCSSRQSA